MKTLAIFFCLAFLAIAQTSTGTYGNGCGGGGCAYYYYASARNSVNDPVVLYFPGSGFQGTLVKTCPQTGGSLLTQCALFTDITNHNFQLYEVLYTKDGGAAGTPPYWPAAAAQDFPCFPANAVNSGFRGNWNNIIVLADSAGNPGMGVMMMATAGKYIAACNVSNTNWTIQAAFMNSAPVDMTANTNGFATFQPLLLTALFNGNPSGGGAPATLAADATMANYVSQWTPKGAPRIVQITGTADDTVNPLAQTQLATAIGAAGYAANITRIIVSGFGHTLDGNIGPPYTGDGWPSTILGNVVDQTYPNCGQAPNAGPEGTYAFSGTGTFNTANATITGVSNATSALFIQSIYAPGTITNPTLIGDNPHSTGTTINMVGIRTVGNVHSAQNSIANGSGVAFQFGGQNTTCGELSYVVRAWQLLLPARSGASSGSGMTGGSW